MGTPGDREARIRQITEAVLRVLHREGALVGGPHPGGPGGHGARPPGLASAAPRPPAPARGAEAQGVRLVVFDMAGTTMEDDDNILQVFIDVAERHRLDTTREELNGFMGASKLEVFQHIVYRQHGRTPAADALVAAAFGDFQTTLEAGYRTKPLRPIAGAEDTFRWLRARGIHVATTTGFYRRVMEICLSRLGWDRGDLVETSVCVDDVPAGRPAPYMIFTAMARLGVQSVHQVVKVGDTPLDLMEGHNAGARGVVGVLSGAHTAESFGRVRHTHILPSVAALPALLESEF